MARASIPRMDDRVELDRHVGTVDHDQVRGMADDFRAGMPGSG